MSDESKRYGKETHIPLEMLARFMREERDPLGPEIWLDPGIDVLMDRVASWVGRYGDDEAQSRFYYDATGIPPGG